VIQLGIVTHRRDRWICLFFCSCRDQWLESVCLRVVCNQITWSQLFVFDFQQRRWYLVDQLIANVINGGQCEVGEARTYIVREIGLPRQYSDLIFELSEGSVIEVVVAWVTINKPKSSSTMQTYLANRTSELWIRILTESPTLVPSAWRWCFVWMIWGNKTTQYSY